MIILNRTLPTASDTNVQFPLALPLQHNLPLPKTRFQVSTSLGRIAFGSTTIRKTLSQNLDQPASSRSRILSRSLELPYLISPPSRQSLPVPYQPIPPKLLAYLHCIALRCVAFTLLTANVKVNLSNHNTPASTRRNFIVAAFENQVYLAPGFEGDYPYQPSPLYSASTVSDFTLVSEQNYTPPNYHIGDISPRPTKRQRTSAPVKQVKQEVKNSIKMEVSEGGVAGDPVAEAYKPKRVRTGCLTCRERHLKCDEGLPHCQNCRKSSRVCKRGVRLNFIDTNVKAPPMLQPTKDWKGNQAEPTIFIFTNKLQLDFKTKAVKLHRSTRVAWPDIQEIKPSHLLSKPYWSIPSGH
jgi:hypothetical protein